MRRSWVRVGLVLVGLACLAAGCAGEGGAGLGWSEALWWAASPSGISVIVGVIFSVLIEYVPGFGELDPKLKRAVFFGACLVVPVGAALLGCLTDGWLWSFGQTFWPAIVAGVVAFGAGTMAHLPRLPDLPGAAEG